MDFGASTACYYPLETEKSLDMVISGGFKCTEIFFNTYSELSTDFVKLLDDKARSAGVEVCAVHPFSSFAETHCLFGNYQRRVDDIVKVYIKYFEACQVLGAKYVVLHGALTRAKTPVTKQTYMERFAMLSDIASSYGVILAQENVVRHFSESINFLNELKSYVGERFKLVLDIKQAVRAGYDPFDFVDAFANDIVHIHISDHNDEKDCMPPCTGNFDFALLEKRMDEAGYKGKYMIEIYGDDYNVADELLKCANSLVQL